MNNDQELVKPTQPMIFTDIANIAKEEENKELTEVRPLQPRKEFQSKNFREGKDKDGNRIDYSKLGSC